MANHHVPQGDTVFSHLMTRLKGSRPHERHQMIQVPQSESQVFRTEERHSFDTGGQIRRITSGDPSVRDTIVFYEPLGAECVGLDKYEIKVAFGLMYRALSLMFATVAGEIFLGNFFDLRFVLSRRLAGIIALQHDVTTPDLVSRLYSLLVEGNGPLALREICDHHLDNIQFELRSIFPYEEIKLSF
jgi:hypothetical protein